MIKRINDMLTHFFFYFYRKIFNFIYKSKSIRFENELIILNDKIEIKTSRINGIVYYFNKLDDEIPLIDIGYDNKILERMYSFESVDEMNKILHTSISIKPLIHEKKRGDFFGVYDLLDVALIKGGYFDIKYRNEYFEIYKYNKQKVSKKPSK